MKIMKRITLFFAVFIIAVCAGCDTHAQSKKAARERWEKTTARVKFNLAVQDYNAQNFVQATKKIEQCINADPDMPAAHLLFGKLLLAQGQPDGAEYELRLTLQLNEELHESWYWLGVLAQQKKDYENAHLYYSKAMTMSPLIVDYILAVVEVNTALDQCDKAAILLEEKMAALPDNISLVVTAADLMLRQRKNEKATELYTRAARLQPQDYEIAESLAYCYILSQNWKEAASIFNKLTANCDDVERRKTFLRMLGLCNINAAQYNKAQSCYTKLSLEDRNNANTWLQIGQAALGAGAAQRAFICSQRALSLKPDWTDAMTLKGCAQYKLKNYLAALESFQNITEDQENASFVWLMRGRCHQKLGNIKEAEEAYKKSLQLKPNSELALLLAKVTGSEAQRFDF
jgi:tetratricopeptide (TPR) repeat protein